MRGAIALLAACLTALVAVTVTRSLRVGSRQMAVAPIRPATLPPGAAGRLAGALRFRTVSHQDPSQLDAGEFRALHRYLADTFPRVQRALGREPVSELSLLYTWTGGDPTARPLVLLSHLDVVPVEAATEPAWAEPPFAGKVSGGFVWGRGAIDDKVGVVGILEAVESLLADGFQPRHTVYLAFGHDEEVGGVHGAARIARVLAERGVQAEFVLDEGLTLTEGLVPGVTRPVALVGTAEKGYLSLELAVESEGGHSSRPPRETAVGILAAALHDLARRPLPAALAGATRQFLDFVAPETSFPYRLALANLWLFGPLVERRLAALPESDAMIRTTTAPTMLAGSVKENVLPARASAVVNFRIRPGESSDAVIAHVRAAIGDPRVRITPYGPTRSEPSPEARTDGPAFAAVARAIRETFPDAIVAPALLLGATDSRHYTTLSDDIFRFLPIYLRSEDATRPHGTNERVAVSDVESAVRFYRRLIENAAGS